MSPFQMILLAVFGGALVLGVIIFATTTANNSNSQLGPIAVWGTLNEQAFNTVITGLIDVNADFRNVTYTQISEPDFDAQLLEALASGRGPDLFVLPQNQIVRYQDKIITIPYESIPERQFKDTFVEEGELYLTPTGSLGVPLVVDPMVLYWNRDLLSTNGFAAAPRFWDEIFPMAEKITRRTQAGEIQISTIAFGEYQNVAHAKSILSALIFQAGGSIIVRTPDGVLDSQLLGSSGDAEQAAQNALRFYTEFGNPTKNVYTWNRSLSDSRVEFTTGDLALYIGYGSEQPALIAQNPNLNFAMSTLPQIRDSNRAVTFGRMYALAIPKGAPNPAGSLSIAYALAAPEVSPNIATALGMVSARRDVLLQPADGTASVLRDSALVADAWLDPDPTRTDAVFKEMIESVTTGSARITEAVNRADRTLLDIVDF